MFRTLVKTDALVIDEHSFPIHYFEQRTIRGARRYSAEIMLAPGDRIILDDDSMTNLEARTQVPGAGDTVQPDAGGTGHRCLRCQVKRMSKCDVRSRSEVRMWRRLRRDFSEP